MGGCEEFVNEFGRCIVLAALSRECCNVMCQSKTHTLECVLVQVESQGQHLSNYPLIFGH